MNESARTGRYFERTVDGLALRDRMQKPANDHGGVNARRSAPTFHGAPFLTLFGLGALSGSDGFIHGAVAVNHVALGNLATCRGNFRATSDQNDCWSRS